MPRPRFRIPEIDPRWYQISILAALFTYGVLFLNFDIGPAQMTATIGAALGVQWFCQRLAGSVPFEPKSALISALSLCLLLRTNNPAWAALASGVAIISKFTLRWNGKHIFNPTNIAIVVFCALGHKGWVSPAQWGNFAYFAFLMACLGGLVVTRAARADVSLGFVAFYAAILFGRAWWLGQPWRIPLHQMESGALLLFTFFMISDPKTTPDSRAGRLLFALLVALGAGFVQFILYRPNGLLYALAAFSLLVPVIDRMLPGRRYDWSRPKDAVDVPSRPPGMVTA